MSTHIVVIDVGSKQSYIFATNKQILAVGASHLIQQATLAWVPEALGISPADADADPRVVRLFSGRALLLLPRDEAEQIIHTVTLRALKEAPGMDIWGHIGVEVPDDLGGLGEAIGQAFRDLETTRTQRRSPAASGQSIPFVLPCAHTGGPASVIPHRSADPRARSAAIHAIWQAGQAGRDDFERMLVEDTNPTTADRVRAAIVSTRDLRGGNGVSNAGWVGVVHADGNGLGQIFTNLAKTFTNGADYRDQFAELSKGTQLALVEGTQRAIAEVHEQFHDLPDGWLLPLILGGDDAALVVDGRYAWTFTKALVRGFTDAAAKNPVFATTLKAVKDQVDAGEGTSPFVPERLSMAAGLAFVKPHFPYAHANLLAEALERSAKRLKTLDVSSVDVHVHYESSLRTLDQIRSEMLVPEGRTDVAQWAGPFIVGDADAAPFLEQHADIATVRRVDTIDDLTQRLRSREISNTFAHALRDACLAGSEARAAVFTRIDARPDLKHEARRAYRDVEGESVVTGADGGLDLPHTFSRIITAIDLADVGATR